MPYTEYTGRRDDMKHVECYGRYNRVKDIMTVPAAIRINGQKAIKVIGNKAYVQRLDGMSIYWYNARTEEWEIHDCIIATNY